MFGSLENKGKKREKRENQTLTKATRLYLQNEKLCQKISPPIPCLSVTKTMGVYIGHSLYENTRKPNILAKLRDKRVIHQN